MKEIPVPKNIEVLFEPFCEECKRCEIQVYKQGFSDKFVTCKYMQPCEELYKRIKGEDNNETR